MKNKPPIYNWPETHFARENTAGRQLDHAMTEVKEIEEAVFDESIPFDQIAMEIADLHHSLETYWRIMEQHRGKEYVQEIFRKVEEKNRLRGYYEQEKAV